MKIEEWDYMFIAYPAIAMALREWYESASWEIDRHEREEDANGDVPSEKCGISCWCRETLHPVYNPDPWDFEGDFLYDPQESLEMNFNQLVGSFSGALSK